MAGGGSDRAARNVVVVILLLAGVPKVLLLPPMRRLWAFYRLPTWFMVVTGVFELTAAAATSRSATSRLGGLFTLAVMMGAVLTNARDRRSLALIPFNLAIGGLALRVVAQGRPRTPVEGQRSSSDTASVAHGGLAPRGHARPGC